jgi:hypothetical protein
MINQLLIEKKKLYDICNTPPKARRALMLFLWKSKGDLVVWVRHQLIAPVHGHILNCILICYDFCSNTLMRPSWFSYFDILPLYFKFIFNYTLHLESHHWLNEWSRVCSNEPIFLCIEFDGWIWASMLWIRVGREIRNI